ncbi:MAG: signal peptidase I [Caldilineaceae bacterium]
MIDANLPAHDEPTDAIVLPQPQPMPDVVEQPAAPRTRSELERFVSDLIQIAVPSVILAVVIHIFLAQATVVYGQSMEPSLHPTERLVIENVSYYFNSPQRHDIVVLDLAQMPELLIKRVIGLPGDTIEIRDGVVFVDGKAQDETFVSIPGDTQYGPISLRPMTYFVMGDNRINSNDSRSFGPVDRSSIVGRAWLRYWPFRQFRVFDSR